MTLSSLVLGYIEFFELKYIRADPPKSPFKRGTLNGGLVPSFLRRVREDQRLLNHDLAETIATLKKYLNRSAVLVTSMPRRRKPSATALLMFSSRWKRMVAGIAFYQFLLNQ